MSTYQSKYNLSAGWNMISSYGFNQSLNDIFSSNTSKIVENTLYKYSNGYQSLDFTEPLEQSTGYWVKLSQSLNFRPFSQGDSFTTTYNSGWNMISSPFSSDFYLNYSDLSSIIIQDTLYEYANGYNIVNNGILKPGKGYWVKLAEQKEITFNKYTIEMQDTANKGWYISNVQYNLVLENKENSNIKYTFNPFKLEGETISFTAPNGIYRVIWEGANSNYNSQWNWTINYLSNGSISSLNKSEWSSNTEINISVIYSEPEPEPEPPSGPDFELLYSGKDNYTNSFNQLNSSDNWVYYNPSKNSDIYFALLNKTRIQNNKMVILRINKLTESVTLCNCSNPSDSNIYWNDGTDSNSIWLDVKVIYGTNNQGDYAYLCTEGSSSGYKQRVVNIYKLDNLYNNNTYTCVNTIPAISYHNLQVFQSSNKQVSYLYGVGGRRHGLEIYDLSVDPEKPFYVGGYIAYPGDYSHSHGDWDDNTDLLYIHDMQVSENVPGLEGKIIAFLACINDSTIVVIDVTNPYEIKEIKIIDSALYSAFSYGLHHCWLTPNNEFLVSATEVNSKLTFIFDISYIFNSSTYDSSKRIGYIQALPDELGKNLHNQYCYKIKGDDENFLMLTAAYASGTHIHKINYQKLRDIFAQDNSHQNNNLQSAIVDHLRLKEDYEPDNVSSENEIQDGVWSVSYCPNSKLVFDSCYYNSSYARGFRVFKANSMPEVEGDRQVPALYNQIVDNYNKTLIIGKDPLTGDNKVPIHPGFYKCILRNSESNYTYPLLVTDKDNNTTLRGVMYGNCKLDLGHFVNMFTDTNADRDISYVLTVEEYDNNNIKTDWTETHIITVLPHTYMNMNEYTQNNLNNFNDKHPPITLPSSRNIQFTYTIQEFECPYNNIPGYKINLSMTSSSDGEISFEELSLYNDSGWISGGSYPGKFSCHSHYYVWEYITGQDSQGTVYDGYHWVKKGRMFEQNWIPASKIQDKYVKIRFSSNDHGTIFNSNGEEVSQIIIVGNPNDNETP